MTQSSYVCELPNRQTIILDGLPLRGVPEVMFSYDKRTVTMKGILGAWHYSSAATAETHLATFIYKSPDQ